MQIVKNQRYVDLRPPGNTQKIKIKVYLSQSMSSGPTIWPYYEQSVREALKTYSLVSNFLFEFEILPHTMQEFTSTNDGIFILPDSEDPSVNLSSSTLGLAEFPLNGSFGRKIWINTDESISSSDRVRLIIHELGHTIGFKHTNESVGSDGSRIPGTPISDYWSVMNQGFTNTPPMSPITSHDAIAFSEIYPQNRALKHFYLYTLNTPERYFYSTSWNAQGLPSNNWSYYRPIGKIATSQIIDTVPLYFYLNSTTGAYYYDVNQINISGWNYQGIAGYVYTSPGPNRTEIKRYFKEGIHLYADLYMQFGISSSYQYIGTAFYLEN